MAHMAMRLFSTYVRRYKVNNVSSMCTFSKDNQQSQMKDLSVVHKAKVPDVLWDELKYANSHETVFKLVTQHSAVMNKKHTTQAMLSLFEFAKKNSQFSPNIIHHPAFSNLTVQLKKNCRLMELPEIVDMLKILCYLEIPGNSTIFQILLQLIRQKINFLDLQQVVFLDFLLGKCQASNLSDSLKLALPLVFQLQLGVQMDSENVPHLAELLMYASSNGIPEKYINNILACLLLQSEKIDANSAKTIMLAMTRIKSIESEVHFKKLSLKVFNILSENIDQYSYEYIIRLLNLVKTAFVDKGVQFYHNEFLNACANYAIKKDIGFEKGMQIAKVLTNMGCVNVYLLEYISDIVLINPPSINSPFYLFQYVSCLSHANYKPQSWATIQTYIVDNSVIDMKNKEAPWVRLALELATLDCYSDKLLSKIYADGFIDEYINKYSNKLDYIHLLYLHHAIACFHPSFKTVNLSSFLLNSAANAQIKKTADNSIKLYLELALGGEQYLANNVKISNGFLVDYMVAYREGNYPIALNQSFKDGPINFEDLNLENYKRIVCVIGFHQGCYTRKSHRLRGFHSLFVKILEHLEYSVIPISTKDWNRIPDSEKIPYLMTEINSKLVDTNKINQESQNV